MSTSFLEQVETARVINSGVTQEESRVSAARVRSILLTWLLPAACLIIGLVLGTLASRPHAHTSPVLVSVNGQEITQDALAHRLQLAGVSTLRKMMAEELQLQFARTKGIAPTDLEVDTKYAQLSKPPNFEAQVVASGRSVSDIKQSLRLQLAQAGVFEQGVTVSEDEVERFYQAQADPHNPTALFYQPETVTLRAIAVSTHEDAAKALQALSEAMSFELIARTYSQDASKTNAGLLRPMAYGRSSLSRMPSLENAIFHLTVGQQLGPVAFNNRWWIFRCEDKTPAITIPFDKAKEQAFEGARLAKGVRLNGKRIEQEFAVFQQASTLHAFRPEYQSILEAARK